MDPQSSKDPQSDPQGSMEPQRPTIKSPFNDSAEISPASSVYETEPPATPQRQLESSNGRVVRREFISYKLRGEYQKPWIGDPRLNRTRYSNWIIWSFVVVGLGISAYINYTQAKRIQNHPYCLVLDEKFNTLDLNVWNREVQIDGFGNGAFDWTTTDERNSFVDAEGLHIVPTLTTEDTSITKDQIFNGYTLNLTQQGGDGSCTGNTVAECSVTSNSTLGIVVPPVRSARINTRGKKSIRFGKVEVKAKLPRGDWLWPAIWMMPEDSVYGDWPRSGEIDIAESRGNGVDYDGGVGGRDTFLSTIHWGPSVRNDAYYKANKGRQIRRTDFSEGFHTFGLEWSNDYLFTYMDSRLQQVLYWDFAGRNMWQQGDFSTATENYTLMANPWAQASSSAPFDQNFYLILNVAVGSRTAWFPDGISQKPWTDGGNSASEFYTNIDTWYPSWPQDNSRGMTVQSVKMWQQGKCL